MKALAFCAFVGRDVVSIHGARLMSLGSLGRRAVHPDKCSFYCCSISNCPLHAAFINRVIRTLRLAGAAVNALVSYLNSHAS